MNCKLFVVSAMLLLTVSKIGNTLTCYQCTSISSQQIQVKCNDSSVVACPKGKCYSISITREVKGSEVEMVTKGCVAENVCDIDPCKAQPASSIKSCDASCCDTDYCNTGKHIMAAKVFICLVVIVGFFFC